jgi:hypothetical protein
MLAITHNALATVLFVRHQGDQGLSGGQIIERRKNNNMNVLITTMMVRRSIYISIEKLVEKNT